MVGVRVCSLALGFAAFPLFCRGALHSAKFVRNAPGRRVLRETTDGILHPPLGESDEEGRREFLLFAYYLSLPAFFARSALPGLGLFLPSARHFVFFLVL